MKKVIFSIFIVLALLSPVRMFAQTSTESAMEGLAPVEVLDTFHRAIVTGIVLEEMQEEYGATIIHQELLATILSGPEKGKEVLIKNDVGEIRSYSKAVVGDKVVIGKTMTPVEQYYLSDQYRVSSFVYLLIAFFILVVLFAKVRGLQAFVGLAMSFSIIAWFILPNILAGKNPLLISIVGAVGIAASTMFVAHGLRKRTLLAFVSTIGTLLCSIGLSVLAVRMTSLFGMGSEEAFFLQFAPVESIQLQGLLLGGILIGTLGVLDDVTTAQAATVEELSLANPNLSFQELYKRGLSVGQEHIISLVNTLVLAYTGASLPLLLIFYIYERPFWLTLNSEIVMEEAVRMVVGSMALVIAVPLTTLLAAYWFRKK